MKRVTKAPRAKKELKDVVDMCTQTQRIIISRPQDAKELLDQTVRRARELMVRFKGVGRTELEVAMSHQVCAVLQQGGSALPGPHDWHIVTWTGRKGGRYWQD